MLLESVQPVKSLALDIYLWSIQLCFLPCRPETSDATFDWDDLRNRNNNGTENGCGELIECSELLANLGNFAQRTLCFINDKMGGQVPAAGTLQEPERLLMADINSELKHYVAVMEQAGLREGLRVFSLGALLLSLSSGWVTCMNANRL